MGYLSYKRAEIALTSWASERKQLAHETTKSWRENTRKRLKKLGFKRIGRGASAVAYARPGDNFILKAFRNDPQAKKWYKFIKANQNNPWLPKLRGKPVNIGETTFIRIERLQPIASHSTNIFDFLEALKLVVKGKDPNTLRVPRGRIDVITAHIGEIEDDDDLYDIVVFLQDNKRTLDLHLDNVMMRGGRQYVLTDPLSHKAEWKNL